MSNTKRIVTTALCMALCVVLSFIFHTIPGGGALFCPMHIPVLLCGLICGWQFGALCGIVGPLLSSVMTQMPPMAYLPPMTIELFVYGLAAGLLFKLFKIKKLVVKLYITLIASMLLGRIVGGIAKALIFMPGEFGIKAWVTSYFVASWPGIVIQLILVPLVFIALEKAKIFKNEKNV